MILGTVIIIRIELSFNLPSNSDNNSNFWFPFDEEGSSSLSVSLGFDESGISSGVLVVVLFGIGISGGSSSLSGSFSSSSGIFECFKSFSISSLLLKNVFWDNPGSIIEEKRLGEENEKTYPFAIYC